MESSTRGLSPASLPAGLVGSAGTAKPNRSVLTPQTPCSTCHARSRCLIQAVPADRSDSVDRLILTRKRVRRGDHLYRAGDAFDSLYLLRSGFLKSVAVAPSGRPQVTAFHMTGELIGLDAIGADRHGQSLAALEASEVCVLRYLRLQELMGDHPQLLRHLSRIMSREIVREQHRMSTLGTMEGEAKVAEFLMSLATRFAACGYSSTEFDLPMSRSDIGSYLGLAIETVSRLVGRLHRRGVIRTQARKVVIVDPEGLSTLARIEPGETPAGAATAARSRQQARLRTHAPARAPRGGVTAQKSARERARQPTVAAVQDASPHRAAGRAP
jgi:CRP/FNR family transcriptional regulator